MKKDELFKMRSALMVAYPSGFIRGQKILDMSEAQIYAIYKSHTKRHISLKKPRMKKPEKQIPGQTDILAMM